MYSEKRVEVEADLRKQRWCRWVEDVMPERVDNASEGDFRM